MKIRKVEVTVKVETLSIDSVYAQLLNCAKQITEENINGALCSEDGDQVRWETSFSKEQDI